MQGKEKPGLILSASPENNSIDAVTNLGVNFV